ncbi:protein FAR1-RELATED SEQUENCE [Citrus sinensis]|nr:protein FAR1-RELATED SEQUENCE [Citrus sinensis]
MEYLENEHAFEELQETRANNVDEIVEPNKCEPALRMLFDNHEEMFAFYKAYGKQEGFPVKSKPNVKNGCDVKIGGCLNEDGKWVLQTLNLQHNHGLSPDKARYFQCNCRISASTKKRIEMNDCAGIRIAQNFNSIVVGASGYENVSFLEKDCRNFVDKTRRLQLEEGDVMTLLKYFQKNIITDQDRAMQKAIENVFPTTRHRWCLWHIMKKVPEKLGAFKEREGIISSLLSAVYNSLSSDAFEEAWHCMITEYDLWDNDWLNGLYEERHRWVPCYLKGYFWAEMSTTQRSESMNAFFYGFVNSKTNLKQFVKQYENALRRKTELEWQADAKCFNKRTPCVSRYEMKRQVEEVYTISKFKEFQEELTALMYCDISDSVGLIYQIIESFGQGQRGFFEVVFEEAECQVNCICSKFQFRGILCRHALAVLIRNSVELLPERYILSRWRKDVRRCYSKLKVCYGVQNLTIQQERYEKMCNAFSDVADIASDDENIYKTMLDWIEKAIKDLPKQIRCENVGKTNTGGASCSSNKQINMTRRKGRPPCIRKESSIRKKSVQKNKFSQKNKDLQENAPSFYHVPNEISTQGSNIATQPVPPYTSQLHYSSPSMTYQGSQTENFQQLLQQQQRNEDNNHDT